MTPTSPTTFASSYTEVNTTIYLNVSSTQSLTAPGLLIPLVYLVVCAVGLWGNTLVIYLAWRSPAGQNSVTALYILNLALADDLFMLGLPFLAAQNALSYWPFGSPVCRVVMTLDAVNQFTSIFCLTVLSLDRYLAVVRPTQSAKWRRPKVAKCVNMTVWILSFLVVLPVVFFSGVPGNSGTCHIAWPEPAQAWRTGFIIYTAALGFFCPLFVICICHVLIVAQLRSSGQRVRAASNRRQGPERKVTKMVALAVTAFIICWLPFYALNIINLLWPLPESPKLYGLYSFVVALSYANSCLNPIIYALLARPFQRGLRRVLCRTSVKVAHGVMKGGDEGARGELSRVSGISQEVKSLRVEERKENGGADVIEDHEHHEVGTSAQKALPEELGASEKENMLGISYL
ncbi:somatostatin receptor type 3 [Spea bombifrons]|uniref:somatostatin receptor type 3 n=1 Tax=Spea bombifrons TaxID=233779 RepID=UPI00234AAB7F|nr:somatostatin receptor type 3 [Spea bombifrons]